MWIFNKYVNNKYNITIYKYNIYLKPLFKHYLYEMAIEKTKIK